MKKGLVCVLIFGAMITPLTAQDLGTGWGVDATVGIQGGLSFAQVGVTLPQFAPHFVVGAKIRAMSALTWTTFINENTKESVSFHPVVVGGILSLGGTGTPVAELFRPYGACEFLVGTTLTPYDDLFYGTSNLVGDNLTVGVFGTFGLEFFSSERWTTFVESGGGFKTLKVANRTDPYAVAASWLGSGATARMGTRFYF